MVKEYEGRGAEILATDYTDFTDCRRAEGRRCLPRITRIFTDCRRAEGAEMLATDFTDFH